MADWIGYRWLTDRFGLAVTQPFRVETVIGPRRSTFSDGTTERRTVQESQRPEPTLAGHLAFALKHEGVHLEALSRLFTVAPGTALEEWVHAEPTGQYARRAGFLYEWLTGRQLDVPDATRGNYVDASSAEDEVTAPNPQNIARWRVRNNLLGSAGFSPQVYRTRDVERVLKLDLREQISELEGQFSAELVLRSAVWLTIKESRSSFAIEHEEDKRDRVQRFAAVIEQRTGRSTDSFALPELEALQREILGPQALHYGLRRSPVFIGESGRFGQEHVHYIGPHWNDVPSLLQGLRDLSTRTVGLSSALRAALLSFGFVYVHPMVDGNGRISRFLINDTLRRDGAIPSPHIVPISARLQRSDLRPLSYDGALEIFSGPLMRQYRSNWSFGPAQRGEDGMTFNLQFDRYDDALHAWRYPDLTRHVVFLANEIEATIQHEMRAEASYLQQHGAARARLKEIIEGPDSVLDRIIRSVRESRGAISGKLRAEYPILDRPEIQDDVVRAIREEFPWAGAAGQPAD